MNTEIRKLFSHEPLRIRLLRKPGMMMPAFILYIMLVLPACKKDTPPPDDPPVMDHGVYILNEGNFQWGNASIDYLDLETNVLTENIFQTVNDYPLGDVVQSMLIDGSKAYIVVNNSGKIEVVNRSDFRVIQTVTGLGSPRYMLRINASKAYLTDLYSEKIRVIATDGMLSSGLISMKGSAEEMLMAGEEVFVCNTGSAFLYVVNANTDAITDSIPISYGGNSVRMDAEQKIWVMCMGDALTSQNAALYRIDPASRQVLKSFDLGVSLQIWDKICMSPAGNVVYYLNNGVWRLAVDADQLPSSPFIPAEGRQLHGLGVDPMTGNLYVSDAIDYVQRGRVYRYTSEGVLIDYFSAGIIPSSFVFF